MMFSRIKHVDWILVAAIALLLAAGLLTMHSFTGESTFFERQVSWIAISIAIFFVASAVDWRFLRRTSVIVVLFVASVVVLLAVLIFGATAKGAVSRFDLGAFFVQPSDPIKLVLILLLAKYFSRRHIEIAVFRHIVVSGLYTLILFILVFLQPDFGSASIMFLIWFGMVLASGLSGRHLALVLTTAVIAAGFLWTFVFADYQRQRLVTFLNPLADITGVGYSAYQSTVAVGSGELLGKGVGFGTQSRLQFLPEYETDFIFAAFAEEWGFIGVTILLLLFGVVVWRILLAAYHGATNFEILFGLGLAIYFASHIAIHAGMNVGLLPVTGTTIPFLSYGGSHLVAEFLGLGILMGMRRYRRTVHLDALARAHEGDVAARVLNPIDLRNARS